MNKKKLILIIVIGLGLAVGFLIWQKDAFLANYIKVSKNSPESLSSRNTNTSLETESDSYNQEENIKEEEEEKTETPEVKSYSNIKQLTFSDVQAKLKKKESFILLLTGTTCPHCLSYKPVLNEVLKENNLEVYELDVWALASEDKSELFKLFSIDGVPSTLFINKGKERENIRLVGNISKEGIITHFKDNGYI